MALFWEQTVGCSQWPSRVRGGRGRHGAQQPLLEVEVAVEGQVEEHLERAFALDLCPTPNHGQRIHMPSNS